MNINTAGSLVALAVPAGAALWVGLAAVQEHDERVPRPVDEVVVQAVRESAEPVLAAAGFVFTSPRVGCVPVVTPPTSSSTRPIRVAAMFTPPQTTPRPGLCWEGDVQR